MKNKISVLTFHNAMNYGAVLQSYALHTWLRKEGFDCEILDYDCEKFKKDYKIIKFYNHSFKGIISGIIKMPFLLLKQNKFNYFKNRYYIRSKEKYSNKNIQDSNKIYDTFIVGSDQVWNLELTNFDENYLLNFVEKNNRKISYAASFGSYSIQQNIDIFRKNLFNYFSISLREKKDIKFLEKITENNIKWVLDPVFLLEKKEWECLTKRYLSKKYVLVYALHEQDVYKVAERIAKLKNIDIICIENGFSSPIKAKYIRTAGITEFLSYIKDAEYVVTDSFHGAAFSIIFEKNLKIVLKKKYKELNSRLETLIEEFQLKNVQVTYEDKDNLLLEKIYYKECNKNIERYILESKKYLKNALKADINENK